MVLRKAPLYSRVAEKIVAEYCLQEDVRTLPSEEQLSKALGTSKNTLREALAELNTQGIISKVHGVGNVVMYSALKTTFRIDADSDFVQILLKAGYAPSILHSQVEVVETAPESAFFPAGQYLHYTELIFADKAVACQSQIYIPHGEGAVFSPVKPIPNMFDFVEKYTGSSVVHSIVKYIPALCGTDTARCFLAEPGAPVISWQETCYDLEDEANCYAQVFFNPAIFVPAMVRKEFSSSIQRQNFPCRVAEDIYSGFAVPSSAKEK